jgi:hypothetical protein
MKIESAKNSGHYPELPQPRICSTVDSEFKNQVFVAFGWSFGEGHLIDRIAHSLRSGPILSNITRSEKKSQHGMVFDELSYLQSGKPSSVIAARVGEYLIIFKCNARVRGRDPSDGRFCMDPSYVEVRRSVEISGASN